MYEDCDRLETADESVEVERASERDVGRKHIGRTECDFFYIFVFQHDGKRYYSGNAVESL